METPTSTLRAGCCSPPGETQSSPTEFKDKPKQQMSASLRQRLKRSRRSFTSPTMASVAKRLCVDEEEEDRQHVPTQTKEMGCNSSRRDRQDVDLNRNDVMRSTTVRVPAAALIIPETVQPCPPLPSSADVLQLRDKLKLDIKDKTETLRRLKMVQMYRGKNDLTQLQILIDKWRACAQAALYELQAGLPVDGRKASLSQLIDMFGLEDAMLHFNRAEEDFTT